MIWLKSPDLHNLTDGNTIAATSINMESLLRTLEKESESAESQFKPNHMFANPLKCQAIILSKRKDKKVQ